ncbi:MAG: hypothetical protein MZV63_27105 [Marinilabiliales bacterium]|nr:hypothetical protein [Marinilabiliales bacterium]
MPPQGSSSRPKQLAAACGTCWISCCRRPRHDPAIVSGALGDGPVHRHSLEPTVYEQETPVPRSSSSALASLSGGGAG